MFLYGGAGVTFAVSYVLCSESRMSADSFFAFTERRLKQIQQLVLWKSIIQMNCDTWRQGELKVLPHWKLFRLLTDWTGYLFHSTAQTFCEQHCFCWINKGHTEWYMPCNYWSPICLSCSTSYGQVQIEGLKFVLCTVPWHLKQTLTWNIITMAI
jgi:hypothetical protein